MKELTALGLGLLLALFVTPYDIYLFGILVFFIHETI